MNKYQLGKQSQWLCDKDCKSVVKRRVFFKVGEKSPYNFLNWYE